jgi:hypothetical protein
MLGSRLGDQENLAVITQKTRTEPQKPNEWSNYSTTVVHGFMKAKTSSFFLLAGGAGNQAVSGSCVRIPLPIPLHTIRINKTCPGDEA